MSDSLYYIYKHTCNITGKSYIGVTKNLNHRWIVHKSSAHTGSSLHFHRAIRKYSADNWTTDILCMTKNEDDAYWVEGHLITEHNTIVNGYNMSEGGRKSPTLRGRNHPLYGKARTKSTRRKISENHADVSGSNNTNAKIIRLRDPKGNEYITHGSLRSFCKTHNLGYSTVCRQLHKGIKANRGSFVGWDVWYS